MLRLFSSVGMALAIANLKQRIRNLATRGILGLVGLVVLIVSLCFFLVAGHLYLSQLLNPIASAAIIGGVLLLIALILFFLASRPMRAQSRMAEDPVAELSETFRQGRERFNEALGPEGSPLRNPVFQAAALAIVAGFVLGRRTRRGD
jgi:hypothetical protein